MIAHQDLIANIMTSKPSTDVTEAEEYKNRSKDENVNPSEPGVETAANRAKRLRIVAQGRRATENSVLSELTATLPLEPNAIEKQDKSSMLRLALTYMRLREALDTDEEGFAAGVPKSDRDSWAREKDLSPVACSLAHVVPVKDDQRQSGMEREESLGLPTETDILPARRHHVSISSINTKTTTHSDSKRERHHQPSSGVGAGQTGGQHLPNKQKFGLRRYLENQTENSMPDRYADELEMSMQHFLVSEVEAAQDVSHPWHDLMSSKALISHQATPPDFRSKELKCSALPLPTAQEAQFDNFLYHGDDPSPTSFYPNDSWGRGDAPPGGSSPDSSSSDSHYYHGRNQRNELAIVPNKQSFTLTKYTSESDCKINSSASSPSVSSETSLVLEPLAEEGRMMLDAVNGFLLVLDSDARVLYVSENVTEHLGFPQADMLGCSILDYIHTQDIKELQEHLSDVPSSEATSQNLPNWMTRRLFYLGMKFSFFRPGTRAKETGYTLVQCNAKLRMGQKRCPAGQADAGSSRGRRKEARQPSGGSGNRRQRGRANVKQVSQDDSSARGLRIKTMILLCRPVSTESVLEIRPDGNMFISRHDLGFHFIFCDPRVSTLIGYEPSDMLGRTAYQFHSPWDAIICKHCAKQMLLSGTATSGYYRFLSRTGAWVWMVTNATIIYDTRRKPQYIVCKNYIVSPKLAERDLSRQRRDFDMMKYPGFLLGAEQPRSHTSAPVGAAADAKSGNTGSGYSYGGTMSLVTLSPKLGEINANAMLDQLFATEQIDLSNSPFHMMRARRRAASTHRNESFDGFHAAGNYGAATALKYTASEGDHRIHPKESSADVEMPAYNGSLTGIPPESDFSGSQYLSSKQSSMQEAGERPPSPILTSLWRRDDHDIEFMTGEYSAPTDSLRMDTSSAYDLFIPSSMANNVECPDNANGGDKGSRDACAARDGISLGFSTDNLSEEYPVLQREPFPILTTTNIYSSDFSSILSDTLSSDFGFQPLLDPPQSIPLTNATSFSDGHDFIFPNVAGGGSKTLEGPFTTFESLGESVVCERMDTPVCFDAQEPDDSERILNSKLLYSNPKDSLLSNSGMTSNNDDFLKVNGSELKRKSLENSEAETAAPSGSWLLPAIGDKSKQTPGIAVDSGEQMEHSTSRRMSNPNISILHDTLFNDGKPFNTSPRTYTKRDEVSASSSYLISGYPLVQHSNVPNQADGKSVSLLGALPQKRNISHSITPSVFERNSSRGRSDSLEFQSNLEEDSDFASTSALHENVFSIGGVSSDLETMMEEDEILSPESIESAAFRSFSPVESQSSDFIETKNLASSSQVSLASDLASPGSSCFSNANGLSLSDSSSSSSDSENSVRPSLLRTLLDKEGAAIQGPVTYAEWVLQKTLKARNVLQGNSTNNISISGKRTVNRKARIRRGNVKRSTELPLPKKSHGSVVRCGKDSLQNRKPTTELPLPCIPLSQSADSNLPGAQFSSERPSTVLSSERPSTVQDETNLSNIFVDDFLLSDDLLDLAVEYCGSIGSEQTDALLSDITENNMSSLEDNLYSLVGSPAQNNTNSITQQNQIKSDLAKSISIRRLPHFAPQFAHNSLDDAKNTSNLTHLSATKHADVQSSQHPPPRNVSKSNIIPDKTKPASIGDNNRTRQHGVTSLRAVGDSKAPNTTSGLSNGTEHMSLLRAAVTTPDVDKLIEQIPFGNHARYNLGSSEGSLNEKRHESDRAGPDIVITKVVGINGTTEVTTTRSSQQNKSFREIDKSGSKTGYPLSPQAPGKLNAIFFDHIYTSSMVSPQATSPIDTSALSSPSMLDNISNTSVRKQASSPRLSVNSSASSKATHSSSTIYQNDIKGMGINSGNSRQRITATSKTKLSTSTVFSSPTCSLAPAASNGSPSLGASGKHDLSSTEPVSVMIMRKEAHRSRRSKSIAVQTDNAPGEVYPEFERSPTDVILYSRSVTSYGPPLRRDQQTPNSTATSPSPTPSPSTPSHSPPSMSQLERFLRGYPGFKDNMDTVTSPEGSGYSPPSSSPPSGPGTPFLQRLLTGELSKDNYRRLDEQMREDERRQSVSSASDLEWS